MAKKLSKDAPIFLMQASKALERAGHGARDAAPSSTRRQDDELANAVFAEIAAAEALIRRASETS